MSDFEKLGVFYLGKEFDLQAQRPKDDLLLYDAKDLVTHGVCVGMTGSGKTGLCIGLLEEAALDGVPAIIIDPKGDLPNLLLTFPELRPEDFRPWVNEQDAARRGQTADEFAAQQAELWRNGLAQWGQDGERIARLKASADFTIYTPGSTAGRPVSVLGSFQPPGGAVRDDPELLRDRVSNAAAGLLSLVGVGAESVQSREHILLSSLLENAWSAGKALDLAALIGLIQKPPFQTLGVMDLESFYPAAERFSLAVSFNNLLAAPGFATWLQGEPLDIARMLHTDAGRPRISIFSIAHLSDAERMFFVTLLLNEILSWTRAQAGTGTLRALVYMDEIFGFFPPVANPPSKTPLLTLLKQARAFGVGVVLATQNPVDLDYKGLANAGTWFIGRLQTERDKARVLEGLEGVAAGSGGGFDRQAMESTLAGLGSRVFLMYNVHEDAPVVFTTRWTMSYLAGPMTRVQIKALTGESTPAPAPAAPGAASVGPGTPVAVAAATPAPAAVATATLPGPPILPPEITQGFLPIRTTRPTDAELMYLPMLLGMADIHFRDAKLGTGEDRKSAALAAIDSTTGVVDWESASSPDLSAEELAAEPSQPATFGPLPSTAGRATSYKTWGKDFAAWLYRTQALDVLRSPSHKIVSGVGESEGEFRARVQLKAREDRDAMSEKLRTRYAPRLASLEDRIRKAQQAIEREQEQAKGQKLQTAISFGATILSAFTGRKLTGMGTLGRATTAARGVGRTLDQSGEVERAKDNLESLLQAQKELEAEFQTEIAQLDALGAQAEELETVQIRPKKTDISVRLLVLAWAPHWVDRLGNEKPAW